MAAGKGESFEELVREYFSRRGFLAVRSVTFQFDNDDVTDIDIWLYGKQASGFRLHGIVDAKNKKSPKLFERILWVKGLQAITGSDRAFVATTDKNPKTAAFGEQNDVLVINRPFLQKVVEPGNGGRLTLEEFAEYVRRFESWKQDGDWLRVIDRVKSAVASTRPYQAFNIAAAAFSFFGERIQTRPKYADQALRCATLSAAFACIALDRALEPLQFSDAQARKASINNGVAYGDSGDGRVLRSVRSVIDVISDHVENGKPVAARVKSFFDKLPEASRSEILAEYFAPESRSQRLFQIARELEYYSFRGANTTFGVSVDVKATLGIFADFITLDRKLLLPVLMSQEEGSTGTASAVPTSSTGVATSHASSDEAEQKLL